VKQSSELSALEYLMTVGSRKTSHQFCKTKKKGETFLLDVHLCVGEDAEFGSSAAAGLCDVNEYDDGAAGDPWRSRVERDGDSIEGAEATDAVAGRGGGAHEVSHGGGAREVRAHRCLDRGAARAGAAPYRDMVHPDPDLIRGEPPEHGLEARLLGRGRRGLVVGFVIEVVVVVEFVILVLVVVVGGGRRRVGASGCGCHWSIYWKC
jgi:hypothetical protein